MIVKHKVDQKKKNGVYTMVLTQVWVINSSEKETGIRFYTFGKCIIPPRLFFY